MRQERQNISWLNPANLHAFDAAALAAENSNSGFRRFQKRSEIFADGFVRAIFDGWSLDSQFERSLDHAGDFISARAWLHADEKYDATIPGNDVEDLS